jgi:hypothetical protein
MFDAPQAHRFFARASFAPMPTGCHGKRRGHRKGEARAKQPAGLDRTSRARGTLLKALAQASQMYRINAYYLHLGPF